MNYYVLGFNHNFVEVNINIFIDAQCNVGISCKGYGRLNSLPCLSLQERSLSKYTDEGMLKLFYSPTC